MSEATRKHPLDFDALAKGSWLETADLEAATLAKTTDSTFGLRVLGLKTLIEERTGIISRVDGTRLRLMTDSEALVWTLGRAAGAAKALALSEERLRDRVLPEALSAPEQAVHENALRVVGEMADAQRATMRKNQRLFALAGRALADDNEEG